MAEGLITIVLARITRIIYWGLGSPLLSDYEHLWIQLADGFARVWTGVLKKEAHKLQNLDEIADPYQKLYKCATEGRLDQFLVTVGKRESTNDANVDIQLLCELSPLKNTFLHIAVSFGHEVLASEIVKLHKPLLFEKNFQGDTALHLAARDGNLDMVKYLCSSEGEATDIENYMSSRNPGSGESNVTDIENDRMRLLRMKNDEENMALHEALIKGHKKVATYLIVADPDHDHPVSFSTNKEGKSPLYLAIQAGDVRIVKCISQRYRSPRNLAVEGKSPLHAAILAKNKELLEIISTMEFTINVKDEKGRTPLHYAASTGYLEGVRFFLDKCPSDSNQADTSGFLPIHSASSKGYDKIVEELLRHFPASKELPNSDGQNILHLAAKFGKHALVNYFLRQGNGFRMLINQQDKEGNTPLHLATIHRHPRVVKYFTWEKKTNLMLLNNKGMTALDIAESTMEAVASFHGRAQPLHVLSRTNAQSPQQDDVGDKDGHVATMSQDVRDEIINSCRADRMELQFPNKKSYKDRVNTLLVVTTLIATVTFAAGFTMPGGYNNSGPHEGKATLLTEVMFQVFVISNTIAMYSSIFVAVTLIWAQVGDLILVFTALRLVMPLLGVALGMLSLAFMAGVYVVVSNLRWLSIVVLIIGICFLYSVIIFFSPLFFPDTTPTFHYITYYPFYLAALSYSNDLEEE
ncbi:hypothetical protein PRUPE_3G135700 [Prunus persica]|uniref:PGG domain-containing protein n=1 Tax=Prunus persica TaxID=3760 RepID=A0A251Q0Y8_PRUPE|nr:protein ACCELERATED CELL DEATH 6 isoform X2 [Prunus persica]ONI17060.1 hypothetical protein PRUPE_3G135700 [Prunus persica]